MKSLKYNVPIIFLAIINCSQPSSKEKLNDSTHLRVDTLISKSSGTIEEVIKPKPIPAISDSSANALNALVMSQFDKVLADSSEYYKVEMEDYYDEYEGQDEMKKYTWYFDKEFSVVYSRYSYQNGAMFKPDVVEFIARNDSIICTLETSFAYDDDIIITVWDVQNGGVKINQSRYSNEKIESVAADYGKTNKNSRDANFDVLKSTLNEAEERKGEEEVYYISIRKPKHAELVDYKEVVIPKVVYDKLKQ